MTIADDATTMAPDYFHVDPVTVTSPQDFYEYARARGPIYRDPYTGVYVLTHYDDIVKCSMDTEHFSACVVATGPFTKFPGPIESTGDDLARRIEGYHDIDYGRWTIPFLAYDPPKHGRYRKFLSRMFTPRSVQGLTPFVTRKCNELVDGFIDRGSMHFGADFAGRLPFAVTCELFGAGEELAPIFAGASAARDELAAGTQDSEPEQEGLEVGSPMSHMVPLGHPDFDMQATPFFHMVKDVFRQILEERRASPRDDLMSRIATARVEGTDELLTIDELIPVVSQVFGAGTETTTAMLKSGLRILIERPELQDRLRREPDLVPGFVEEVLRYDSPTKGHFRLAKEDAEIGGVPIPAHSIVFMCYHAGDRDAQRFENPHEFDPTRPNARQNLAFGHGPHLCLGAHVARLEGLVAFRVLVQRLADIRFAPGAEPPTPIPSFLLSELGELVCTFKAVA